MKLFLLYKDQGSGSGGCPSVYIADSGEMVIQGLTLDSATRANLADVLPGEDAVRISADIIVGAAREYQTRNGI